jgi:response regulator RpfG family c-di-GMP phosphodiesterase
LNSLITPASHGNGCILVVDDEAKLRSLLSAHLRAAGFDVLEAKEGRQGLEMAIERTPDIIIMDIAMPTMDGITATRELKSNPRTQHIPVIMLTGLTKSQDLVVGLDAGAQDYLRKPFDLAELLARVRTVYRLVTARKELDALNDELENEVRVKTRRLEVLYGYMQKLSQAKTRDEILDLLLTCMKQATGATRVSILLTDAQNEYLVCERASGIDPEIMHNLRIRVAEGISGQVFRTGKTLAARVFGDPINQDRQYDRQAFLSTPLISTTDDKNNTIIGVINVTEKADDKPFSEEEIECVRSVADATAIALDNLERSTQLQRSVRILLQTVGHLAEYRDEETTLHLERVRNMARVLSQELSREGPYASQVNDEFVEMITQAAPMHDIGKVGVPDEILLKPGQLTEQEFDTMKTHTEIGRRVLSLPLDPAHPVPLLNTCIDIAYCHHERFDGTGYPRGIPGEDIPLAARIIALVDAYDAITSRRPYKKEKSHAEAVDVIVSERGAHFDPAIVDAFLRCQGDFDNIRARYEEPGEVLFASSAAE